MYQIKELHSKRRLVLMLDKYQDHDRPQFNRDMKIAALSVKGASNHFDVLADFSNSMVMPRAVADDSEDLATWMIANGLRKSANVSQSITQRMQIRRVTRGDMRFELFDNRDDAERWLET